MRKATKVARKVELTFTMKLRSLAKLGGVGPFIFTVRGGASSGVIISLAEALRREVFTQTQRANSLQFSFKVGVLPSCN